MYKNEIIEEINSYVGHRAIADVRFVKKGKPVGLRPCGAKMSFLKRLSARSASMTIVAHQKGHLAEGLREKVVQLRFAQAKRKKAYQTGPCCGRWMAPGERQCLFCRSEARHALKRQIRAYLDDMPWLSWEALAGYLKTDVTAAAEEQAYNEVRRNLIYTYIEKVYYEYDTAADDFTLAMLITARLSRNSNLGKCGTTMYLHLGRNLSHAPRPGDGRLRFLPCGRDGSLSGGRSYLDGPGCRGRRGQH